jgi:hypothetical protein
VALEERGGPRADIPPYRTAAIEPFLSKPLVVTANELDNAARIVATEEDRVVLEKATSPTHKAWIPRITAGISSVGVIRSSTRQQNRLARIYRHLSR